MHRRLEELSRVLSLRFDSVALQKKVEQKRCNVKTDDSHFGGKYYVQGNTPQHFDYIPFIYTYFKF